MLQLDIRDEHVYNLSTVLVLLIVPGILTRYPHVGVRPAAHKQKKIVRNMFASYDLAGQVNL